MKEQKSEHKICNGRVKVTIEQYADEHLTIWIKDTEKEGNKIVKHMMLSSRIGHDGKLRVWLSNDEDIVN